MNVAQKRILLLAALGTAFVLYRSRSGSDLLWIPAGNATVDQWTETAAVPVAMQSPENTASLETGRLPSDSAVPVTVKIMDAIMAPIAGWKTGLYWSYASTISDAEQRNGIPTDVLARLLYQESHWRADIISGQKLSPAGAIGISQFMPATAAEMGVDPTDPVQSIYGAGRYLRKMFNLFNNWSYALMAYNWGPGNVQKYLAGERNPPPETVAYVHDITNDVPIA